MRLRKEQMHEYQVHGVDHIIDNPYCGLFLDMGLGKTATTLTAIDRLMFDEMEIARVLVIAPLRVAQSTWTDEANKWEHLKHLKFSKILGTPQQRIAALKAKADIYLVNRENVPWLVTYLQERPWLFDMLVVDELSSFKNHQSQRFKNLRTARPKIKRVVGLTGTPAPNGLIDLWSQLYLLDMGERLGKMISWYRNTFFTSGDSNGHVVYKYDIKKHAKEDIYRRIGDICISMKAKDYLTLPKRTDIVINISLDEETMARYEEFEKTKVLEFMREETEVTAMNAAVLAGKLQQFTSGAVYHVDPETKKKEWIHVHDAKLEALEELIEAAQGDPLLVFYGFQSASERIKKRFKSHSLDTEQDIANWNKGKYKVVDTHPASTGHGLNLQHGGHLMAWFDQTYSLELYQQAIARLDRQGQPKPVFNYHLLIKGTIDKDVYRSRTRKEDGQNDLMQAVKARIEKYVNLHK